VKRKRVAWTRCNTDRSRTRGLRTRHIQFGVTHHENVSRLDTRCTTRNRFFQSDREEVIAIGCVIAKRPAPKVFPEIEVLQFEAGALLAVSRQQSRKDVPARRNRGEEGLHARENSFFWSRLWERLGQTRKILREESLNIRTAQFDAGARSPVVENPLVGPARHRNSVERSDNAEDIFKRAIHRAAARASGSDERSVDIEKYDPQDSERTFPARGPFGEVSSSNATRCPSAS
jgi:hypothetical protein